MSGNETIKRKALLWAVILAIVIVVILFVWQKNLIQDYGKKGGSRPHFSVKQIYVHDIGADRISMTAQVMVSNPLLIELKAEKLEYELLVDSVVVMQSEFEKHVTIKSLDSVMLTLPIEVLRDSLAQVLNRFERNNADSAVYTLRATLDFEVPVASDKTYTVNKTQKGPAFRLLTLRTEDVDIEKFGFRNSDLSMSLIVENPNAFGIGIKDVDYALAIGKDFHMSGHIEKVIDIPAHSTIDLPLKMDIQTKNIPRLTWQVLFKKKHTPFQIDFTCAIAGTNPTFSDTRLHFKRNGLLDELKKAFPKK